MVNLKADVTEFQISNMNNTHLRYTTICMFYNFLTFIYIYIYTSNLLTYFIFVLNIEF